MYDYDLALLELEQPLYLTNNEYIEAAQLPPPAMVHTGKEIQVGGWGVTIAIKRQPSNVHMAINVTIKEDQECVNIYKNGVGDFCPDRMFCAGREFKTTCAGDSGAGAVFNGWGVPIILGVVSYGARGCTHASVYTKIEKALPWIFRETKLK